MRAKRIGTDSLAAAAYAAGFAMAPIDEVGDLWAEPTDETLEVSSAATAVAVAHPSPREVLTSTAGQVSVWIRQRVPLLGGGAPA